MRRPLGITALAFLVGALGAAAPAEPRPDRFEQPAEWARDEAFNRAMTRGPAIGASITALANSVSVTQSGRGNTLNLVIDQRNAGDIHAGAPLNGRLSLD